MYCLLLIEQLCTVCVFVSAVYVQTPTTQTHTHVYTNTHIPGSFFFPNSVNGFLAAGADDKLEKKGHANKFPC